MDLKRIIVLLALLLVGTLTACGVRIELPPTPHNPPQEQPPPRVEPPPHGDLNVFSNIIARVSISEYSHLDYHHKDLATRIPPIKIGLEIRVTINQGTRETRVAGLRIFANGNNEIKESGSAGIPEQFSYLYYPKEPAIGKAIVLEFRYKDATFSTTLEPLVGEITAPPSEHTIGSQDNLPIKWTQTQQKPPQIKIHTTYYGEQGSGACSIQLKADSIGAGDALLLPYRLDSAQAYGPPCTGEVALTWSADPALISSPFKSLSIGRSSSRMKRFHIQ